MAIDHPSNELLELALMELALSHCQRICSAFFCSAVFVFVLVATEFAILRYFNIGTLFSPYASSLRIERSVTINRTHHGILWARDYGDLGDPCRKSVFAIDFRDETVSRTEPRFLHPSAGVISGRLNVVEECSALKAGILGDGVTIVAMENLIEAWVPGATEPKWTSATDEGHISAIDCADSSLLYAVSGKVTHLDASTGRVLQKSMNVGGYIYHVTASPCRQYIAVVSAGSDTASRGATDRKVPLSNTSSHEVAGAGHQLVVMRLSDQKQCLSRLYVSLIFKPVFSPDSRRLVFADDSAPRTTVCTVEIGTGTSELIIGEHSGATGGYWGPDSKSFYSWGHDGFIRAWSLETGELKWKFQLQSACHTPLKTAPAHAAKAFRS